MTNNIIKKSKNKSDKQKRLEKKQEEENKLKKQEDIKNIVENIENLIESYKDNNEEVYLYHYSTKPFKELYTIEKQISLGINNDKYKKLSDKFDWDKYSYIKHISLFIDPIPLDLVRKHFTNNKTYQENDYLYEHKIKLSDIKSILMYYMLVENKVDNFYYNYIFNIDMISDDLYANSKRKINELLGNHGEDYNKLRKLILDNKGVTKEAFEKLVNSDKFGDKQKGMYAPSVPHLFIYPKDGIIKVDSVKKVYFDKDNTPLTESVGDSKFYHISFKDILEGVWNPKNPDGYGINIDEYKASGIAEPNLPRISVSTSIEKCFQAIYPNISKLFEEKNYPYMEFYVYTPILKGNEKIISSEELVSKRMVHDAHMTDEYIILNPVYMKKIYKIKIYNTNKNTFLYHHPFNDNKITKIGFAPDNIKYDIIKEY